MKRLLLLLLKATLQALVPFSSQCEGDVEENPAYKKCEEEAEAMFNDCVVECDEDDLDCRVECNRILAELIENCPCMSGCPDGCPCPEYECPSTTSESVLVLNTGDKVSDNVPLVVDSSGNFRQPNFSFEAGTQVFHSCGVTFEDTMYVFGGQVQKTQISKVEGCSLKRIGSLPFQFQGGACASGGGEIYLCFDYKENRKCRKSKDPERGFSDLPSTNFDHGYTRIATNGANLFAVGERRNNKFEMYKANENRWQIYPSFKYSSYVYHAPLVFNQATSSLYVFGGQTAEGSSARICRYWTLVQVWYSAGYLNKGRYGHGALELDSHFLVIGGERYNPTEKCTVNENAEVACNSQQPELYKYVFYPELFKVPYNFC